MDKDKIYKFAMRVSELSEKEGLNMDEAQYAIYLIQQSHMFARIKLSLARENIEKGGKKE